MMLTIYLFFLHFLADFVFQSREMAEKKSSDFKYLFNHVLIQITVMFFGLMLVPSLSYGKMYQIAFFNAMIHGLIDWNIWKLYKFVVKYRLDRHYEDDEEAKAFAAANWEYWKDKDFYITIGFDQFLHFTTILVVIWMVL